MRKVKWPNVYIYENVIVMRVKWMIVLLPDIIRAKHVSVDKHLFYLRQFVRFDKRY